ncbi:hypothetical protein ACUN9Y_13560 [Halomonas sp. V046]|uniref:hypothetical protein n=1 Tax=Halomonas sp. V046 TaxID=3459611 RepID=UPI0040446341
MTTERKDRKLDALERELDEYLDEPGLGSVTEQSSTPARSRPSLSRQQLEDIIEHLAAERRAKRAAITANLLDLLDRAGTTVGALSLIALFFADKAGEHGDLLVANTAKPLWGAAIGFGLAVVASYSKALLTWRGK